MNAIEFTAVTHDGIIDIPDPAGRLGTGIRGGRHRVFPRPEPDTRGRALNYLIDTNALSELKKWKPHPGVAHWFAERPGATLYLSLADPRGTAQRD
jgi:hypothetical protein